MNAAFRLAVDLGTCHTVAVVRRGDEPARTLLFDGSPLLPSGVYVGADGEVVVGRDAERMSHRDASRYEPYPKRQVDDGTMLLGDTEVPVANLLAAILRRVAQEAGHAGVDPVDATVLTCPADWGARRRGVLLSAAADAGFGEVALVDEPIAAARYCRAVLGQRIGRDGCLVVFDFGGGTLDVSVVRATGEALEVLAVGGLDDLGGVDLDAALVGHLGQLIAMRDPGLWRQLSQPDGPVQLRDRRSFWTEVRCAKEMLSRGSMAPVTVQGSALDLHLTREELERVVGPLVDRAVDETRRVLQRSGVAASELAGILLVGGSSRTPLVASRLHARFKVAPTVPEQPELPVAFGALLAATAQQPASLDELPGSRDELPVPIDQPAARRRRSRLGRVLVLAVVVGLAASFGLWGQRVVQTFERVAAKVQGLDGAGGSFGNGKLVTPVNDMALTSVGAAAVELGEDTVFVGSVGTSETALSATRIGSATPGWTARLPMLPSELRLRLVDSLLIVDGKSSITHNNSNVRAVVDAISGTVLWGPKAWVVQRDMAYLGTDVLVENSGSSPATMRMDLRTGAVKWSRPGPSNSFLSSGHLSSAARVWPSAQPGPATVLGDGTAAQQFTESLAFDGNAVVQIRDQKGVDTLVYDADTGATVTSATTGIGTAVWTVYDGLVVGQIADSNRLAAFGLGDLARRWEKPWPAGVGFKDIRGCGPKSVCVTTSLGGKETMTALNAADGAEVWHRDFEETPTCAVLASQLVVGDDLYNEIAYPQTVDHANGNRRSPLGNNTYAIRGRGAKLLMATAGIGAKAYYVTTADVTSGALSASGNIGPNSPVSAAVSNTAMAVATKEHHILVYRI